MRITNHPLLQLTRQDKLIQDYLLKNEAIASLVSEFAEIDNFEKVIAQKHFKIEDRGVLRNVLLEQYSQTTVGDEVKKNIDALQDQNTFTITTGHQLCLFTGPLYFIYKIISAIKLCDELRLKYPSKEFVPVYWMATEDHDLAEINHAYLFGKKLEWSTQETGAVGMMKTEGIQSTIDELETLLGNDNRSHEIASILREAYENPDLASATRHLVNRFFGRYGLVVVDGNHRSLKHLFRKVMANDMLQHHALVEVTSTNEYLKKLDYKTQVHPRQINLFYLKEGVRSRIEKADENTWRVVDSNLTFSKAELEIILEEQTEVFSPNVILRPLFQETILPNIAYIGGPGEISYWLQLKSLFDKEQIPFPILALRDSALLINSKAISKLSKLGLSPTDLFDDPQHTIKRLVNSEATSLLHEKNQVKQIFDAIATKLKAADNTLEGTALAEAQKQLAAIDNLEKRAIKALKTKEENKINQFNKIHNEFFPNGAPQERHDNFFQHLYQNNDSLLDDLHKSFYPLSMQYHVLSQEEIGAL